MAKNSVKSLPDVRFEEVSYKCKCGYEGKDTILVAENTGVLDTKCPNCKRRVLEIRIFETQGQE